MSEVFAIAKSLNVSPRKLASVANLVKGKDVGCALRQLDFSRRAKVATMVRKLIFSALSNAQNNFGLDVDNMKISSIFIGKGRVLRRFRARARGRASKICKSYSNLRVVLREC